MNFIAAHLLQTTLFALAVWLLTFILRKGPARVCYQLWMAASLKFLVPFALLGALGASIPLPKSAAPSGVAPDVIRLALGRSSPATFQRTRSRPTEAQPDHLPIILLSIWAAGSLGLLAARVKRFRRTAQAARKGYLEPGVLGVFRPELILPAGIYNTLPSAELESILEHERCHIARRDNLTAAAHMAVETVFWFHPITWWIGGRLIEERERACDEAVVASGADRETYARAILNVCKLYLHADPAMMHTATGARLASRIREIMTGSPAQLSRAKRALLASASLAAVLIPIAAGIGNPAHLSGQPGAQPIQPRPRIEAASIKRSNWADQRHFRMDTLPGGRIVFENIPLLYIVSEAYRARLTAGPEFKALAQDAFDIEATAEKGSFPPGITSAERRDRFSLMLQVILEERFQLKAHRESKDQPAYILTVAKGGPKLQLSKTQEEDCPDTPANPTDMCHHPGGGQGRGIHGNAVTIADVAYMVQAFADKPLVDQTGLTKLYNIQTEGWMPIRPRPLGPDGKAPTGGDAGIYDSDRQTIFDVFRQLGLKMEAGHAVVDSYYIEHIARPSAN